MANTYESILDVIKSVPRARSSAHRDITWLTEDQVVGVSRDTDGHIEVFLVGSEIKPQTRIVRSSIEFHVWHREGGENFRANRLLFPEPGHYDQVAALICTELLREGANRSLVDAFSATEPIIELAIERVRLSNQALLGLTGEMVLLDSLSRYGTSEQVKKIVGSWNGWRRSSRDFVWDTAAIEVKTTTLQTSSHLVEGLHQVEREVAPNGAPTEEELFLVSIGLRPTVPEGNFLTLPYLIERILDRIKTGENYVQVVSKFLSHVSEYGAEFGLGYNHFNHRSNPYYQTPYLITFFRSYKMSDNAIKILRRSDLTEHQHVHTDSFKFRINLPNEISRNNPIHGASQFSQLLLNKYA